MLSYLKNSLITAGRPCLAPLQCELCEDFILQSPGLCSKCEFQLIPLWDSHCEICALPFEGMELTPHRCQECLEKRPCFQKLTTAFEFEGAARELLRAVKFGRSIGALQILAQRAQPCFEKTLEDYPADFLVPMPLSWRRRLQRGFNQSYVLLQMLQQERKIPLLDIVRRQHTLPQARKNRQERLRALRGVFSMVRESHNLAKSRVLLVDDVVTTGATAEALSECLLKAGAQEVRVFGLARVRKKV